MNKKLSQESYYRTQWLIAHNHLHEIVHNNDKTKFTRQWNKYLMELRLAKKIAARPA